MGVDDTVVAAEADVLEMSLADRLKQLTEVNDFVVDEDGGQSSLERLRAPTSRKGFVAKRATTEALAGLLSQAMLGGDDGLLELALSVKDSNVLHETIKGLDSHCVDILLNKLTTRLASKPHRAEELALWLSCLLEIGRAEHQGQLHSLKNLLRDRVEAFPHLLRLEGRLSMVNAEKRRRRIQPDTSS